jgi:Nif-specific regulatory protein
MSSKLSAVSGPHRGAVIDLSESQLPIGRDPANRLCLDDGAVSRRHCVIEPKDDGFKITDLGSSNGTFVNGVPVKERGLQPGDQLRIGNSLFVFGLGTDDVELDSNPVELKEYALRTSPIELPADDGSDLLTKGGSFTRSLPERAVRDLRALMEVSAAINNVRGVEALEHQLLQSLFGVIRAERGAILLLGEDGEEIASVFGLERESKPGRPVDVSRTIVNLVLEKSVPVLSNDVLACEDFSSAKSLQDVRSVLAVPLETFGRKVGIIYLDSKNSATRFDDGHLLLLTAIAGTAALALESARRMEVLGTENERLRADLGLELDMVGESPAMRKLYEFVAKVAPTDSTVLIHGESGTGKELVARAIHRNSPRAEKPFVAINCAALAETLLESELFGHEKGAFTGATARKQGRLEMAEGGTVFLDEIGELAPALQVKLLRVLQEREFERVGGTRPIKVDARIVTATNRNLPDAVRSKDFREDLYYRINVVSVEVPPLRARREDIPLLAMYFAQKYSKRCNRKVSGVSAEARECLMQYAWPGNVRELENGIERAVVLGATESILPEDLPEFVLEAEPMAGLPIPKYHEAVVEAKKQVILKAFNEADYSHVEAAKLLDVHPNYLHRLIRNMNLRSDLKKQS